MPSFRHRLTRAQQRVYDRSDGRSSIALRVTPRLRQAVALLPEMLALADRARIEGTAQLIADEMATALQVAHVRMIVDGTRPSNARGELHGLYTPANAGRGATIKVWMLTAKRGQVVAFKTFLRTFLHEICHHLDYVLLRLSDSFHTEGFYRRESSLFYQIGGAVADSTARRRAADPGEQSAAPPPSAAQLRETSRSLRG